MREGATEDIFSPLRPPLGWGVRQGGALRAVAADTHSPHQTSDTFHFLRNKACLWDEVIHTAASGTGAWGVGVVVGKWGSWSLLLPPDASL